MATLEKIRSRQKLLFTIVIIALFLFIISIADANSIRNIFGMGPGSTVAQVGNIKIDHESYRQRVETVNQQQQNQQQDRDVTTQNVIQQLLGEALLQEQFDQLGIRVTDSEISRAMTGANPHPAAMRFISSVSQALQLPTTSGSALLDAIMNPGRYNLSPEMLNGIAQYYFGMPTMAAAWAAQEQEVERTIQQQAFGRLMGGLFTANDLDARAIYNDNNNVAVVSYVTAPFSTVKDDEIEVTDADLKAKWNELRPMFKIAEETRQIDYICVPVQPSRDDLNTAEIEVDKAVEALRADSGAVVLSAQFVQDNKVLPLANVKKDRDFMMMPDSLIKKGGVYKFPMSQNTFRIARVADITSQIDSINLSMVVVETAAEADSILNQIKNGTTTFKALAEANAQTATDSIWQSLVGAPENIVKIFENGVVGEAFVYNDSVQNAHAVYKINKRHAPKQFADMTLYTYVVDPSATTLSDIKSQLNGFLASNNRGDLFSANADSLYNLRHTNITASTPKLDYMPNSQGRSGGVADSRHAIQWAMKAKKGEVSPIFEDNRDYYIVVCVKEIYDSEYIPWDSPLIKDQLTAQVKADKKAGKLIDKYAGKGSSLDDYARLMGTEVLTDSTVVFASPRFATLMGNQYQIQAQVAAAPAGKLVGPVQGANEVMVFVVNGTSQDGRPYDFDQDGNTFVSMFGFNDTFSLLAGDRRVKNNMLKFENYDK